MTRQRIARPLPSSPFVRATVTTPTTDAYRVGDRVTLDTRGMGRVVAVSQAYVTVDFGSGPCALPAGTKGLSLL